MEGVGVIAGGVGNGGLGRTRVGGRYGGIDGGIAGVVKNIVDAIEKGRWEQVVGPEVEQAVVRDLVGSEHETKLHTCEGLIAQSLIGIHPSTTATTTTNTTTTMTNNDEHNNDTIIDKYVVLSPLIPTVDNDEDDD